MNYHECKPGIYLGVFVVMMFSTLTPVVASEPPDWTDELRTLAGKTRIAAWFDAGRTRAVLKVGDVTSKVYRAWKVEVADLDGDGLDEVILGVWSDAKRHDEPNPHRSVWVLKVVDGELKEVWRGSALARPLRDFTIRTDGATRLVADERLDGHCYTTQYRWNGFGFSGVKTSKTLCQTTPTEERTR